MAKSLELIAWFFIHMSVLDSIISSKTRTRILMRLFLNPSQRAYLRELADEFNVSPSQVSYELSQLSKADLLKNQRNGRQIFYYANQNHPLFPELSSIVRKTMGMNHIVEKIAAKLGNLNSVFLVGDYAQGKDSGIIDLILVGNIDQQMLQHKVKKTEKLIDRKIRTLCLNVEEYVRLKNHLEKRPFLILWEKTQEQGAARKSNQRRLNKSQPERTKS